MRQCSRRGALRRLVGGSGVGTVAAGSLTALAGCATSDGGAVGGTATAAQSTGSGAGTPNATRTATPTGTEDAVAGGGSTATSTGTADRGVLVANDERVLVANGRIVAGNSREAATNQLRYVSTLGPVDDDTWIRTTGVLPRRPFSKTESVTARKVSVAALTPEPGREHHAFRGLTRFKLVDREIDMDYRVTLPDREPFALVGLRLTNRDGKGSVRLDHDDGDVHDGITVLDGFGLAGLKRESDGYWFDFPGRSARPTRSQDNWASFPPADYCVMYDRRRALLAGLTEVSTTPKMWVLEDNGFDATVNETTLGPDESVRYVLVFGVLEGGDGATDRGSELYAEARRWTNRLGVDALVP